MYDTRFQSTFANFYIEADMVADDSFGLDVSLPRVV
jgi:hypothetical protein